MKFAMMLLVLTVSTSSMASQIKYSCTTLGKKSLDITIDFSKVPKRLVSVLENGSNITSGVALEQGTKNTWAIVINGQVRIEKTGTTSYQQVVKGGTPGAIPCTPSAIKDETAPVKPLY